MSVTTHLLIDSSEAIKPADGVVASGRSATGPWQVRMKTCHGGRSEGVQVIELDNGAMCIDVLPTRGMGIWRVRRGDHTLGWQAPARDPVHPAFVPLMEPTGLGWLDGFNELLCRCGLESNGPPEFDDAGRLLRPLHGRIANSPAHRVELVVDEQAGTISLRGIVEEARLFFQSLRLTTTVTASFGGNELTWIDEVENIGGREAVMQLLYHFNIGHPLLRADARVDAPIAAVAPKTDVAATAGIDSWNIIPPPKADSSEQVFVADLAADQAGNTPRLVTGLADGQAVSLRWNKNALPCFTLWRSTLAEADGYVIGIEPATNFPNTRTFERGHGRVVTLGPGQRWRAEVTAAWHNRSDEIASQESAIREIRATTTPALHASPQPDWSE